MAVARTHIFPQAAALLALSLAVPAQAQAPATQAPPPARPPRVVTDVSSFHLDRAPHTNGPGSNPNQIGAASRGGPAIISLCAPVDGLAANPRPLFVWKAADLGQQLTFSLLSDAGDVLYEGNAAGGQLEYPADAPALDAGKTYSWKVSGAGMDKLPDPVSLTLIDKPTHDALAAKVPGAGDDPLARAQLLLRSQLWYDAEAVLLAGIRQQPGRSDLSQQLELMYKQVAPGCVR